LALAGCTGPSDSTTGAGRCSGVGAADVRGPHPAYASGDLAVVPGADAVCRALWLPRADHWFVPQGVALDGHTAWVSGYRWRPGYGNRPCRLIQVDLRTGRLLADQPRLEGAVPGCPRTFCRHGGGLALTDAGLWVAETQRLWLVDPDRVGGPDAVRRVWRIEPPVSGGSLVAGRAGRFGLADFHRGRASGLHWFDYRDVLDPAVRSLGEEPGGPSRAVALRRTEAPRYAQGGAVDPSGPASPYLVSSVSTCSMLLTPVGRRVATGPGLEGVAFDGRGGLWAVLESGTRPYQRMGRALVPMLVRYDVRRLLDGPDADCPW
jgi:hypothetical protein